MCGLGPRSHKSKSSSVFLPERRLSFVCGTWLCMPILHRLELFSGSLWFVRHRFVASNNSADICITILFKSFFKFRKHVPWALFNFRCTLSKHFMDSVIDSLIRNTKYFGNIFLLDSDRHEPDCPHELDAVYTWLWLAVHYVSDGRRYMPWYPLLYFIITSFYRMLGAFIIVTSLEANLIKPLSTF